MASVALFYGRFFSGSSSSVLASNRRSTDPDQAVQALAFLPNEIWIHAGDSITWTFPLTELHTATFLTPGPPAQVRPSAAVGCPGTTASGSAFDGSTCVNSGRISTVGTTYTVAFPTPGNYRLVCLVHVNMTGIVHVLSAEVPLPHDQDFYNSQAARQQHALLHDRDGGRGVGEGEDSQRTTTASLPALANSCPRRAVSRACVCDALHATEHYHPCRKKRWGMGQLGCEWPYHHVRAGAAKTSRPRRLPSANVFVDPDGARHAIISSTSDSVHSGFIAQAGHETHGVPQASAGG